MYIHSIMRVLWIQRLSCCGNTHSFLNYEYPELVFREFEFVYHPSLSTEPENQVVSKVLNKDIYIDILIIEGAVRNDDELIVDLASKADYVIAVGNCASFGNIPALSNKDVSGLQFRFKEKGGVLGKDFRTKKGFPVINLSGCPAHPEWIVGTLLKIKRGKIIELDEWGRPKDFYTAFTHWGCSRNEYFEWKVEPKGLGTSRGCLFYKYGCKGPMTNSMCNIILWNGVSSKTRSGTPCFGCTEFDFPREGLWETKVFAGIPAELPRGVSKRAYIMISGIAKTFTPDRLKE